MPFIHVSTGGYAGDAHAKNFTICDKEMAYVMPAKAMALTVIDLLYDKGETARSIRKNFVPRFTRESYLAFWDKFRRGETCGDDFKREREAEGYEPEPESTEYIASVYRLAEASPYASGAFL
jgi:hypothetical protein